MTIKNLEVEIIPWQPELAEYFYSINEQWVSDMFVMEEIDEQVLSQPQKHIIDKGGQIWFARNPELGIIGTCAVKKYDEGWYELTKMGVLETSRGLKAGEILLKKVIEDCENNPDVKTLFLLTNKICEAAIHLYEKNGFVHDAMIKQKFSGIYKRSNVYMLYTGKKL